MGYSSECQLTTESWELIARARQSMGKFNAEYMMVPCRSFRSPLDGSPNNIRRLLQEQAGVAGIEQCFRSIKRANSWTIEYKSDHALMTLVLWARFGCGQLRTSPRVLFSCRAERRFMVLRANLPSMLIYLVGELSDCSCEAHHR